MIASNKKNFRKNMLYKDRERVLNWFEKNHPDKFDLYGPGWEVRKFYFYPFKLLNKLPFITQLLARKYKTYRGVVKGKSETMQNYKFAICFENMEGKEGYITEKILDCINAGCIPVYRGAPDITDYIPANCFINFSAFENINALYSYMDNLPDTLSQQYLEALLNFSRSDSAACLSMQHYATILTNILFQDNSELEPA